MMTIQMWLSNRLRKYADGVALFKANATPLMLKSFGGFFGEVSNVPPFDNHFSVLVNKLTIIMRDNRETKSILLGGTKTVDSQIKVDALIIALQEKEREHIDLINEIDELTDEGDEKSEEINELSDQRDEMENEIRSLHDQIESLHQGLKIVTYTNLPDDIKALYDRTRAITPLYAVCFNDMANESLTDEERAELAEQVKSHYDERAECWKQIDDWSNSTGAKLYLEKFIEEKTPEQTAIKQGVDLVNRIERLKENIKRCEKALLKHKENGKENYAATTELKIKEYQAELDSLNAIVKSES